MRRFLLTVCCVALLLCGTKASAQRCGDYLWLYVRDSDGKVIPPESLSSAKLTVNDEAEIVIDLKSRGVLVDVPEGIKSISLSTFCGYRLMKVSLSYQGREMVLKLHNVPGDFGNILLESVPFHEGTFEIDMKGHERKNCEKDASIKEPERFRSDQLCVIRPTSWKRTQSE